MILRTIIFITFCFFSSNVFAGEEIFLVKNMNQVWGANRDVVKKIVSTKSPSIKKITENEKYLTYAYNIFGKNTELVFGFLNNKLNLATLRYHTNSITEADTLYYKLNDMLVKKYKVDTSTQNQVLYNTDNDTIMMLQNLKLTNKTKSYLVTIVCHDTTAFEFGYENSIRGNQWGCSKNQVKDNEKRLSPYSQLERETENELNYLAFSFDRTSSLVYHFNDNSLFKISFILFVPNLDT